MQAQLGQRNQGAAEWGPKGPMSLCHISYRGPGGFFMRDRRSLGEPIHQVSQSYTDLPAHVVALLQRNEQRPH
jgi:hypothetical protein